MRPVPTVLDAIWARRTANARFLAAPGPDTAQVTKLVAAACRAPDHGRLAPFRFIAIAEGARDHLAAALADAAREAAPDLPEAEIERAREKAHQGPVLLMLVARLEADHPKIPASDQWLAVGCALENLLLAAHAEGVGVAIRSGKFLEAEALRAAFRLATGEHLVSLLALGTAAEYPPERPKKGPEELLSVWNG